MRWHVDPTPARYIDVRLKRLAQFVIRHPRWTMPFVMVLFRIKYAIKRVVGE